jgi:hypothetical protein
VRIVDISSGSCFVPIDETEPEFLHAIVHPCSEPHTLEQIHIFSFERALAPRTQARARWIDSPTSVAGSRLSITSGGATRTRSTTTLT